MRTRFSTFLRAFSTIDGNALVFLLIRRSQFPASEAVGILAIFAVFLASQRLHA